MDIGEFDFDLPTDLIAQEPAAERGTSRLLCVSRDTRAVDHRSIDALTGLLRAGDVLVVNNTRVVPARLLGQRTPSGGAVECLLLDRIDEHVWEALVHPGQRLGPGAQVAFEGAPRLRSGQAPVLRGEVIERRFHGRWTLRLWTPDGSAVDGAIDAIGHMPLPPYIKRPDRGADRDRYQTVYARERGSVAAPTAGLHFSQSLLDGLATHGIVIVEITLHVGYGTFQPVRVERVEDHRIEPERYGISDGAATAINLALDEGRRVVAVGTTTTRALEAVASANAGRVAPGPGSTDVFIYPGFQFRVIGGLLTNFHLPRSSLLMLVSAFAGHERVMAAYRTAVAERYRFYSYGDAMLIL